MGQCNLITIAYSSQGAETSLCLRDRLREYGYSCEGYLFEKYQKQGLVSFQRAEDLIDRCFQERTGIIFICAMGIAVRQISRFIRSKQTDSAVLVMDELGKFVIPVLAGHIGGANELAGVCAELMGAMPVITTATDLHGKFAVDVFAVKNDLCIDNMGRAKEVSVAILASRTIPVYLEECYVEREPSGPELTVMTDAKNEGGPGCGVKAKGKTGVMISPYCQPAGTSFLHLVPRQILLGVGCRKGIGVGAIERAVFSVLEERRVDRRAICRVCTIDRKKEEPGLVEFCRRHAIPLRVYSCEELAAQEGEFTGSSFVYETAGVDNVCERSAIAGGGERLIVRKQRREGVTVAAAVCRKGLDFQPD